MKGNNTMEVTTTESMAIVSDSNDLSKEIRTWFSSLSANERVVALGFADGAMITALLSLASSSGFPSAAVVEKSKVSGVVEDRTTEGPLRKG
jgi:predicted esterase